MLFRQLALRPCPSVDCLLLILEKRLCLCMKVKVRCSKFECREDIHFKIQPGPDAKMQLQGPRMGIEQVVLFRMFNRGRWG